MKKYIKQIDSAYIVQLLVRVILLVVILLRIRVPDHGLLTSIFTPSNQQKNSINTVKLPIDWNFALNPKRQLVTIKTPLVAAGKKIWVHDPIDCVHMSGKLASTGAWEPDVQQALIDTMMKPEGKLFVDIGGNIGAFSIVMAAAGFDVEAFEPMTYNIELFSMSILDNQFEHKIKLYQVAAGETQKGKVCLNPWDHTRRKRNMGNGRVSENAEDTGTNCAPMVRLESMVSRCPDLVKVDVEGFETAALKGLGLSNESDCRPDFVTLEEKHGESATTHLKSLGYKCNKVGGGCCDFLCTK